MGTEVDTARLAEDLRAVVGKLVRSARRVDRLPQGDAAALGLLDRDGPLTTARLAQARRVRHQSMARIVGRLADAGLVARVRHDTDGRMVLVRITETGRRALNEDRAHRADWLAAAITGELTESQRVELARGVALLAVLADAAPTVDGG